MDFEMDIRSGTNGGPLYANVFSTANTGGDGYSFTFNDSNNKISLYYDSTLLTETTVSGLFTASEDWQKVVINYERGLIAISLDGSRKFYYKDIERETPYVNGEYVSFSSASTDGRKIRDLRIVNGEKWVYSGESNVVYTQGSVGIGVTDPTAALDVSGTVKATVFDGDGSAITNISSANVGDFASNVVRIENLETSNGHIWSSLASNVTILRGEIDSNLATARTDLQSNVTILRDEIDSNLATARTDLQSNVTILRDTAITFTGTKTFQDDVVLESNLRVQGDLLVANTVNMTVSDPILELGSNNLNTGDVGIVMTRHGASNSNVAIFFDETADILKLGYTPNGANDTTLEFDSNALAVSVQGALYGEIAGSNTITASTIYGEIAGSNALTASTGTFSGDFEVGTANMFVDTTAGNVGIGTTSPATLCDLSLASGTDYSNTVALTIRNYSSDYTQIANGFGSRIHFRTNRGTTGGSTSPSADIKGYVYSGAGGTGDYHALDLDVYGDNGSLNKGISILSTSYSGGPANTIMHGNVGIGTADPNALLHIEQTLDPILRIQGTASDSNAYIELRETTGDSYGASLYYEGTSAVQGLRFGHFNGSSTLRTDMAIDRSTGRVGIGFTNPLGKLAVLSPLSNIEATDLNSLRSNAAINIGAYGYSNDYLSIGLLGSSANDGNNPSAYIQNRWDGGLAADLLLQPGGGNVGIGTTNPTARLELYSSTLDTNHITVYADNSIITQDRIFVLSDVNGSGLIQMGDRFNNDSTTYKIQLNTEGDSYFSGGNVGIGTTNPETALVVDGTITIRNGSQVNAIRTDSDGNLQFLRNAQTNDTPTITINDETGNVGVGTTNPAYTLDVNGSARVGALTATTGTFSGNVRCNSFTLSQKAGEQGEFIVERKDNGYTQSALPLAHIDAFGISVNIPNVDYTTTSSKLTFTIDDNNTGSRWMLKMLVRDAEGGASVRVNSGTTHELHYNDVPQDPREDNDDSWTTIDITDDVVYAGATNTIYWWAPTSDGSSVRAAYVFPTSGPALPNEPVETDLHLYNGLYVSSNLTVNTDDLFVDTNTGRVGVGTTNPKALLHIEQTLDPILRIQGTAGDSNAYIELRETDSDNYGASLYYEGTSSVQGLRFGHFDGSSTLRTDMAIDRGTGRVGIGTDS